LITNSLLQKTSQEKDVRREVVEAAVGEEVAAEEAAREVLALSAKK